MWNESDEVVIRSSSRLLLWWWCICALNHSKQFFSIVEHLFKVEVKPVHVMNVWSYIMETFFWETLLFILRMVNASSYLNLGYPDKFLCDSSHSFNAVSTLKQTMYFPFHHSQSSYCLMLYNLMYLRNQLRGAEFLRSCSAGNEIPCPLEPQFITDFTIAYHWPYP